MGVIVNVKADFQGLDLVVLENYLKALVAEATGEPVGRVLYHGIVRTNVDLLREQFGMTVRS